MSKPAVDPTPKRRLLVLASTFPAGISDGTPGFVRDLTRVESTVFQTTVLVPAVPHGAPTEHIGDIEVRRFRYFPRRWEDLADGAILENLRERRSRWIQVPSLLACETMAVARAVRRSRPDVIHVHWIIPQGLAALVAGRGVPMLVTTLGGDVYGLTDPLSRFVIRRVLRRAAHVTTMNSDMRERLLALGADPETTHVLPMGADVGAIRSHGRGVTRDRRRILFVGRLVEKKGLRVLLEALRHVTSPGISVRIVGDGPLRSSLEALAAGLPVEFVGALPRAELAREYAAAALTVFPSVAAASGDQDGLPVALLEAMAAGSPVIASDLPGLNDAVLADQSGLLVPAEDAPALAEAITTLMNDSARREVLGAAASARAEEYSVQSIGRRYIDLLDSTVLTR